MIALKAMHTKQSIEVLIQASFSYCKLNKSDLAFVWYGEDSTKP